MTGKIGNKTLHESFTSNKDVKPVSKRSISSKYGGNIWKEIPIDGKPEPKPVTIKRDPNFSDRVEFTSATTSLIRRIYDYAKTLFSTKTSGADSSSLERGLDATRLISVLSLPDQIREFVKDTKDEFQEVRAFGAERLGEATLKTIVGASGILFSAANGITGLKQGLGVSSVPDTNWLGPLFTLYQAISLYETAKIVQKYCSSRKVLKSIDNSSNLYQKVLLKRIKSLEKEITDDPLRLERSCAFTKSRLMEAASKEVLTNLISEMKDYRGKKINKAIDKLIKMDDITLKKRQQMAVLDQRLLEVKASQKRLKSDVSRAEIEANNLIKEIPHEDLTRVMRNLLANDSKVLKKDVSSKDLEKIIKGFLKKRYREKSRELNAEKKTLLKAIRDVRCHKVEAAQKKISSINYTQNPGFMAAWKKAITENVSHQEIAEAMNSARNGKGLHENEKLLGKYGFKVKNLGIILEDESLSELELEETLKNYDSPRGRKKAVTLVSKLRETAAKKTWGHKFSAICRGLGLAAFGVVMTVSSWIGSAIAGTLWLAKEVIQYKARYGKADIHKGLNVGDPERAVEQEDVAAIRHMIT